MSANLLPALDTATEAALRASIRRFGVLVPVLRDQHGDLVDGHHRVRLSGEEDKSCPEVDVVLPDEPGERAAALSSLNDDRRQRMNVEQRKEVVVALRADGFSTRAIAGAVGVDHTTVVRDLADVESTGATAPVDLPDRITGLDGRSRPATAKRNGKAKLTAEQEQEIVQRRHRGEASKALATEYGISTTAISKIWRGNDSGPPKSRKGSDRRTLDGLANTTIALTTSLAGIDIDRMVESQDPAHITRLVRALNDCRLALSPAIRGLNGGNLP